MSELLSLCHRNVPSIVWTLLPDEAHQHAAIMWHQLHDLGSLVQRFGQALALYDKCENEISQARHVRAFAKPHLDPIENIKLHEKVKPLCDYNHAWQAMAKRDAAMTIFDFSNTIVGIQRNREASRTLCSFIDREAFARVYADFREHFRDRDKIRHAAAHPAEIAQTVVERDANAADGPYRKHGYDIDETCKNIMINGGSDGRTVIFTLEKRIMEFDFSYETFGYLYVFQQRIYGVFSDLEKVTFDLARQRLNSAQTS